MDLQRVSLRYLQPAFCRGIGVQHVLYILLNRLKILEVQRQQGFQFLEIYFGWFKTNE